MRTYRVKEPGKPDVVYKGFNKKLFPLSAADHITVVMIDGDPEIFVVDNPSQQTDLFRYLTDRASGLFEFVGTYSRR